MNIKYFVSSILLLICISCQEKEVYEPWKIAQINQRSERISVLMETQPKTLQLKLKGQVDGPYQVFLTGSSRQGNETLSFGPGAIDTVIIKPWVDQICKVIYVPNINKVKSGDLEIEMKLRSK